MKIIEIDLDYYLDPDFKNLELVDDLPLGVGKSMKNIFPKDLTVIVKSKPPLPDFMVCGAMYIVSEKLMNIFRESHCDAEFFAIDVWLRKTPYSDQNFFCFNPLNYIDAIDYLKSQYVLDQDHKWIESINKLVIDEKKVEGKNLFKVESTNALFISEEIAKNIVNRGIIGIKLIDIKDFRFP